MKWTLFSSKHHQKIHNGFPVKSEKNEKINFVFYHLEKKGDRRGHQKVGENYPWGHFHFFILSSRLKFALIKIRKLKRLLGIYCSTAFSPFQRLKEVKEYTSNIIEHSNEEKTHFKVYFRSWISHIKDYSFLRSLSKHFNKV